MKNGSAKESHSSLRYQLIEDGQTTGFIEYYLFGKVAIVTHTEVDSTLEGRGHGACLACNALNYFSRQGVQLVPVCGFFAQYVRKNHHQFAHLVTPESRRIFNIGTDLVAESPTDRQ